MYAVRMILKTATNMMSGTDLAICRASSEFVWENAGETTAHSYILPTLKSWLSDANAHTVLDLGCGNGRLTAALAQAGFDVTGMDMSESGIAIASRTYPDLLFHHSDLSTPLPSSLRHQFDAVAAVEVVEHLLLPRQLFERAREALRPGGIFVVTTPYHGYLKNLALALTNKFDRHWHPLRDYGHVKFFSRKTLSQLFVEQDLVIERFARVGRVPALAKSMIMQGSISG